MNTAKGGGRPIITIPHDGSGAPVQIDIAGHCDLPIIEDVLAYLTDNLGDAALPGQRRLFANDFDIAHRWRRQLPGEDLRPYQYQDHPGRGATAVTCLTPARTESWCYRCQSTPAVAGVSLRQLKWLGELSATPISGSNAHGFAFLCNDCYSVIQIRAADFSQDSERLHRSGATAIPQVQRAITVPWE